MYLNKATVTEASTYKRIQWTIKKLDTTYNPNMAKETEPIIEVKYKVTGDTRVIPIIKHKEDEIQWSFNT